MTLVASSSWNLSSGTGIIRTKGVIWAGENFDEFSYFDKLWNLNKIAGVKKGWIEFIVKQFTWKKNNPNKTKNKTKKKSTTTTNRAYNVNLNVYLGIGSQWIALDKL